MRLALRKQRSRGWVLWVAPSLGLLFTLCSPLAAASRGVFVLNISSSMPRGIYRVVPESDLVLGSLVLMPIPKEVQAFAHSVPWLSTRETLLKRVVAMPGMSFCISAGYLRVNNDIRASIQQTDSSGTLLPHSDSCGTLQRDQVLVLGDSPSSFDSRYFGPVASAEIKAIVTPFLTL